MVAPRRASPLLCLVLPRSLINAWLVLCFKRAICPTLRTLEKGTEKCQFAKLNFKYRKSSHWAAVVSCVTVVMWRSTWGLQMSKHSQHRTLVPKETVCCSSSYRLLKKCSVWRLGSTQIDGKRVQLLLATQVFSFSPTASLYGLANAVKDSRALLLEGTKTHHNSCQVSGLSSRSC